MKHGVRDPVLIATETTTNWGTSETAVPMITEDCARVTWKRLCQQLGAQPACASHHAVRASGCQMAGLERMGPFLEDYSLTPAYEAIRDAEQAARAGLPSRVRLQCAGLISDPYPGSRSGGFIRLDPR